MKRQGIELTARPWHLESQSSLRPCNVTILASRMVRVDRDSGLPGLNTKATRLFVVPSPGPRLVLQGWNAATRCGWKKTDTRSVHEENKLLSQASRRGPHVCRARADIHTIISGAPPEGCPPLSPRARGFAFTALSLKNMLLARKPVVKREALSLIFNLPGLNDRKRMSLGAPTQPHWTFHVSKSEESSARAPKPFLHDSRRFHLLF